MQLDLADPAARLRHRVDRLGALPRQPCRLALKRDQPINLHQILGPELTDTLELAPDQVDLLRLGLLQREVTLDFLAKLSRALLELRFLADTHITPGLEQLALAIHDGSNIGILRAGEKPVGKDNILGPVTLGDKSGAPSGHFVEPLDYDREVGTCDGVVQSEHDVSRAHALTVPHEQFSNDPTGRVLDLLDISIDHNRARRDDGTGQFGCRGPAADAADQQDGDDGTADQMMANRATLLERLLCHRITRLSETRS